MIPIEQAYPNFDSWGESDYDPLLESFGYDILVKVDDNDYQGDSRVLFKDGPQYGILIFGWGSCSGCDALQACSTLEEVNLLRQSLLMDIIWFTDAKEALKYVKSHDWFGDYSYWSHNEEQTTFINRITERLEKEVEAGN